MNTTLWYMHAITSVTARHFIVPNELNETGTTSGPHELKAIG